MRPVANDNNAPERPYCVRVEGIDPWILYAFESTAGRVPNEAECAELMRKSVALQNHKAGASTAEALLAAHTGLHVALAQSSAHTLQAFQVIVNGLEQVESELKRMGVAYA